MVLAMITSLFLLISSFNVSSAFTSYKPQMQSHKTKASLTGRAWDTSDMIDDDDGAVSVVIKRNFPHANPFQARNAWLDYHWKRGGGLPILIQSNSSTFGSSQSQMLERTIYPVLMKEILTFNPCDEDTPFIDLQYKVTETGPIYGDVIDGSHVASVTFSSATDNKRTVNGCEMIWKVRFSTSRWEKFYTYITQFLVGTSANTVQEAVASPRLFTMSSNIAVDIDAKTARDNCLEFVWMQGGGLPLPPAIPYGKTVGESRVKRNLLRIPPIITESITDIFESENEAGFEYTLNSPGWLTFPFLMHSHKGIVKFCSTDNDTLDVYWDIEIRPFKFAAPLVEKLVEMTVSTILRNFRVRLMEPGAVVVIKPPRGNTDWLMGRKDFGSVSKETWLGGVMDSHLSDSRSTLDQSLALVQPWTWGRSGKGVDADFVSFRWLDA